MRLLSLTLLILVTTAPSASSSGPPGTTYSNEEALRRYAAGRLLEEQGARGDALDEYYKALSLDVASLEIARRVSEVAGAMGDPGRSLEFADKALALSPSDARSEWLRGAALINLGRNEEALEALQRAVSRDSTRVEYFRTLARAAERLDRYDLVAASYRRVVWLEEGDPEAWFQLAAAEARRGHFESADSAIAEAAEGNPIRPGIFFLRGWISESLGRQREAAGDYRNHLEIHPDDHATRRRLTGLLVREKRYGEALSEIRLLVKSMPRDLELRHMEADLCFTAGRAAEGIQRLDRLRKDFPDDLDALSVRVGVLARHGRAKQASEEAGRWVKAHPGDLRGRLLAARALEMKGDRDAALAELRQAGSLAPDSLGPRVLMARTLEGAGRLAEAEKVWKEALERFPDVTGIAFDLALCREKQGDIAGAEAALRDVLRREPRNPTALNFLGYLFADHNRNLDEAVVLIQKALEQDPQNGAYLDSLGWAYYRLGRLADAREHLERAVRLSGGDPVIHEHLGDVYKDLLLNDLARDQYRKSLANDQANARVKAKLSSLR